MIIINSSVITATEILEDYAVVVNGDTIEKLIPMNVVNTEDYDNIIDAKGGYVTAGFIDIHSDYIEGIIAPRPTTIMDFNIGKRIGKNFKFSRNYDNVPFIIYL